MANMRRWLLSSLALTAACTGPVRYASIAQLPEEPLHYVIVAASDAPDPKSVAAREWARSQGGRFELWSFDEPARAVDEGWIVTDLGVAVIGEKLVVEQLLNAVARHRQPLHVVVDTQSDAPSLLESGLDTHCRLRADFNGMYDLDCELAGLRSLIDADWVERVQFFRPGWVRWR